MRPLMTILTAGMLVFSTCATYAQTSFTGRFHKVIISPYIQATFVQGDEESVIINNITVDSSKLHVEVHGGTLRVYLDGAKDIPRNQRDDGNGYSQSSHHLYPDHAATVTVRYRKLDALSLRGTETFLCQSPLSAEKFTLRVYGEATVVFTEVHISRMYAALYGESSLEIRAGAVDKQYYTCYGEGKINTTAIAGQAAKVTAFGESEFRMNVSDRIKITAFGEARLRYRGNPAIVMGIHIGGVDMQKIE